MNHDLEEIEKQFQVFKDFVKNDFTDDEIDLIWECAATKLSIDDIMTPHNGRLFLEAMRKAFEELDPEFSNTYDEYSSISHDDEDTRDVVLSMLYDHFQPASNSFLKMKIREIAEECNYDVEEATNRICQLAPYVNRIENDFPSLENGIAINNLIGDAPIRSVSVKKFSDVAKYDGRTQQNKVLSASKDIQPQTPKSRIIVKDLESSPRRTKEDLLTECSLLRSEASRLAAMMIRNFSNASTNQKYLSTYYYESGRDYKSRMMNVNTEAALCALLGNNSHMSFHIDERGNLCYDGVIEVSEKLPYHLAVTSRSATRTNLGSSSQLVVDFHNLTVSESIQTLESILNHPSTKRYSSIRLIVGAGKHSRNSKAVLSPKLMKYLQRMGRSCNCDGGTITIKI